MDSDTFSGIVWGTVLVAILMSICFARYRRRRNTKRALIVELLKQYFQGDMPPDQLGIRAREIAGRHFMGSAELYSLVIAAFQGSVDATLARQTHSKEDEKNSLRLLAALKKEFGLTDRYQTEAWRPGRE
jgi:hypothetical protein